eukprot:2518692-Prymnesium_polylepis.1
MWAQWPQPSALWWAVVAAGRPRQCESRAVRASAQRTVAEDDGDALGRAVGGCAERLDAEHLERVVVDHVAEDGDGDLVDVREHVVRRRRRGLRVQGRGRRGNRAVCGAMCRERRACGGGLRVRVAAGRRRTSSNLRKRSSIGRPSARALKTSPSSDATVSSVTGSTLTGDSLAGGGAMASDVSVISRSRFLDCSESERSFTTLSLSSSVISRFSLNMAAVRRISSVYSVLVKASCALISSAATRAAS